MFSELTASYQQLDRGDFGRAAREGSNEKQPILPILQSVLCQNAGRIYLMSNQGLEDEFVNALEVRDGKKLWSVRISKVGHPNQQRRLPTLTAIASATYCGFLTDSSHMLCFWLDSYLKLAIKVAVL